MECTFRWVRSREPDAAWLRDFSAMWPAYRRWYLSGRAAPRPDVGTCRDRLGEFMPELLPLWERLNALVGADDVAAGLLSLYRPPAYIGGCSQAFIGDGEGAALIRNYDYDPRKFEARFVCADWTGRRVLFSCDCLWGALDGLNAHGVSVALAFGGRVDVGDGFGIPIILRYVLETCRTTEEAVGALTRIPSHMAYNISVADAAGERAVVELGPEGEASVRRDRIAATNHQGDDASTSYAVKTRSAERSRHIADHLASSDEAEAVRHFLAPPLFQTRYDVGFGTLYTVTYRPRTLDASYHWPDREVVRSLASFEEDRLTVAFEGD